MTIYTFTFYLSIEFSVSHSQDSVIQTIDIIVTLLLEVNSIGVETETLVRGINGNRDRFMSGNGNLNMRFTITNVVCKDFRRLTFSASTLPEVTLTQPLIFRPTVDSLR